MPKLTTSLTEASATYSLAVPAGYEAERGSPGNPYIYMLSLPSGLMFIIIGSILAALFAGFVLFNIVTRVISHRRAKHEKEMYYPNFNHTFGGGNSSTMSTSSIYLSKYGTDTSTLVDTTTQGKSYQSSIMGDKSKRGSMFISPVLELMNSKTDLSLPMYQKPYDMSTISLSAPSPDIDRSFDGNVTATANTNANVINDIVQQMPEPHQARDMAFGELTNSPSFNIAKMPEVDSLDLNNSSIREVEDKEVKNTPRKKDSRPPSQYLDDLLKGIPTDYL